MPPDARLTQPRRAPLPAAEPSARFASSQGLTSPTRNLKRLIDRLALRDRPKLLDVGPLCSANIEWFIQCGIRVTVNDRVSPLQAWAARPAPPGEEPAAQEPPPIDELAYPPESFDAVICWDLFDYLHAAPAHISLERLGRLLKPKGLLFAMFKGAASAGQPAMRYRVLREDLVAYEPLEAGGRQVRVYQNREIEALFSGFLLINSCILKNQVREVLVQAQDGRT